MELTELTEVSIYDYILVQFRTLSADLAGIQALSKVEASIVALILDRCKSHVLQTVPIVFTIIYVFGNVVRDE
jgi:hypothetical protein